MSWTVRRKHQIGSSRSGFTLIELMVVITIIGIMAAVGFASFRSAQIAGRDGRRKQDLRLIQQSLELYAQVHHGYPPYGWGTWGQNQSYCDQISDPNQPQAKDALLGIPPAGGPPGSLWATSIARIPTDPTHATYNATGQDYYYWVQGAGDSSYMLFAVLENTKDPAVVPGVLMSQPGAGGCGGANATYNYMISSSN